MMMRHSKMTLFPPKNFKCMTFTPRDLKNQFLKYGTYLTLTRGEMDKALSELRLEEGTG